MANMKESILNVYEMQESPNVCEQTLREVLRLPLTSMAHVTMLKGASSLLHEHKLMEEAYFILGGKGTFYRGDEAIEVGKGAFLSVPPRTPHKLKNNNNNENLEHLVFAFPGFNSEDVFLLENNNHIKTTTKYKPIKDFVVSEDGALVIEVDSEEDRKKREVGFAYGILPPKRKAVLHYHGEIDEIYYIVSGSGTIRINNLKSHVKKGNVITIPREVRHSLENLADKELDVLCISSPAYESNDFVIVEE